MKTTIAHERSQNRTRSHNRVRAHSFGGNGHRSAKGGAPAVRPEVTAWLAKPKHNLIGGQWVSASSGQTFKVFNPADATVIARVPDSAGEDINRAVSAARKAFDSGPWRRMPPSERGRLVWRIG